MRYLFFIQYFALQVKLEDNQWCYCGNDRNCILTKYARLDTKSEADVKQAYSMPQSNQCMQTHDTKENTNENEKTERIGCLKAINNFFSRLLRYSKSFFAIYSPHSDIMNPKITNSTLEPDELDQVLREETTYLHFDDGIEDIRYMSG